MGKAVVNYFGGMFEAVPAPQSAEVEDKDNNNHDASGTIGEEEDTLIIGVEDSDLFLNEDISEEKDAAKKQESQIKRKQREALQLKIKNFLKK